MTNYRNHLLGIVLCIAALGCAKDGDSDQGDSTIVAAEYAIELGTGEQDDPTGCLQMGIGNGDVFFGASLSRVDDAGELTNSQCVIGIVIVDDDAYFIAGPDHDVALETPDSDDDGVRRSIDTVEQRAIEGEFEMRVFPKGKLDEGEPLFVGQLFVDGLRVDDGEARLKAE